jgi:adenine-specific DNA-methyltransferase
MKLMDKLKMHTPNKVDENFQKLAALFPNAVTETITGYDENGKAIIERAIDKDILMQEISTTVVEGNEERYQFTWPDKKKSILLANAHIAKTLRPCKEESVDFDNTENLYIEGDNLDVLKLLQETYLGKVKMIYIDPPYNTGNDFVYDDGFAQDTDEYLANSGQYDEEGNRLVKNLDSNGRFHTDWLNMIYPRLKLAKDLLTDDGVIFISIDDNEVENLKKCCDEVFGRTNFLAQIMTVSNPGGRDYKQIAIMHEYLLVYGKSIDTELHEIEKKVEFSLKDKNGGYELRELRNRNPKFHRGNRPNLFYPFYVNGEKVDSASCCAVSLKRTDKYNIEVFPYNSVGVESVWRWGQTKALLNIDSSDIYNSNIVARQKRDGGWNVYEKCRKSTSKAKSIWDETEMRTEDGTRLIRAIFNKTFFDHPKPLALIKRSCQLATNDEEIILDFFSGSATTAHAVMQLNAEDGGNRKFIMVQLPEETDKKSEAYKAGYKNICEIGKERIRRAGKKIKEENKDKEGIENLDTGFRVLKLDSTNMKDVYYNPDEYNYSMFDELIDNIKEDRTSEDLLFQVMLDLGVLLSSKIEESIIGGKKVFNVAEGFLIACFDENVTEETIKAIAQQKPYYFVMRDSSMANDSVATNFEQIFATYSPSTVRKVL